MVDKNRKIVKVTVTMFEMIVRKYVTRLVNKNRKTKEEKYTKAAKKKLY